MTLLQLLSVFVVGVSTPSDDSLVGRYTLDPSASDDPSAAVEEVVGNVRRFGRGRARSRLTPMMTPSETLEVARDGEAYLVVDAQGDTLRVVPGAGPVEVGGRDDQRARMSAEMEGESLLLRMEAARATRSQRLTPTATGLEMTVVWDLEIARAPVTLVFRYEREGDG